MMQKTFVKTFENENELNEFITNQKVEVVDVKPILKDNNIYYVLLGKIKVYN